MQDTIKNNVLIAKFMGATVSGSEYKIPKVSIPYQGWERFGDNEPCLKFTDECRDWEMEYHKSWGWIMPVVEKINTVSVDNFGELYVVIHPTHCTVREGDGNDLIVKHTDSGLLLDAVYLTIVEFVKWYNEHKK
jgi:hypothetical protein